MSCSQDPTAEDVYERLQLIRSKFRTAVSVLKVPALLQLDPSDALSF
jgi:hypothetical protein